MKSEMMLLVLLLSPVSFASSADSVLGVWAGVSSIIEVTETDGRLSARIIALQDPVYREDEDLGTPGEIRKDDQNPDESERKNPVLGLELLSNYQLEGDEWEGKIYDPESGNIYSSNMKVEKGVLMMRGYIGVKWLGRTAEFHPIASCNAHVLSMLKESQVIGHCDL